MRPLLLFATLLFVAQSCRKHEDRCRLIRTENDGVTVNYIYNDNGQLKTMRTEPKNDSFSTIEWNYFYNSNGQLDSSSELYLVDNSYPEAFAYEYNDGNLARVINYDRSSFFPGGVLTYKVYDLVYDGTNMAGYLADNYGGSKSGQVWSDFKNDNFHKSSQISRSSEGDDQVHWENTYEFDDCVNPLQQLPPLTGFPTSWQHAASNVVSHDYKLGNKGQTIDFEYKYKRKLPRKRTSVLNNGEELITKYFCEFY